MADDEYWGDKKHGIPNLFSGMGSGPPKAKRFSGHSERLQMDRGSFYIILILIVVAIIVVSTGSIIILHNLWELLMRLSQTIPLWLGAVLLILLFVVLRRPKKTYYR